MRSRLLLVLVLATPIYVWRLDRPGFSDTEGMFAEPAREMGLTGDWVTPRMNGEPFLTKPPLAYWLAASLFRVTGPTEYARLWPAVAALSTVAVTGALGAELFGAAAGIAAAVVLATSMGFLVEARLLRADMILVLAVTCALWCYVRLRRGAGLGAAIGLWAAVGVGLLDKGLLAAALPGGAIAAAEIASGELRLRSVGARLMRLRAPLGVAVVAAIAVPWHALAAARNPGFLWDYVVNQHLLFFFDAKLPRDSIPDSLAFFWGMLLVRMLPWTLLLPAAVIHAWRAGERHPALRLPVAWIVVVLALFSLASSRLEHYSLPALPAVALVVGLLLADLAAGRSTVGPAAVLVPPAAVAVVAVASAARGPAWLLGHLDPALLPYGLHTLVRPSALVVAAGLGLLTLSLAVPRMRGAASWCGALTAVAIFAFVQVAHERVEPLFSWRPFARTLVQVAPTGAPIFFRASDEYQLCGGLDYYTRRYAALLSPPGWVPPTFLADRVDRLFTSPRDLASAWARGNAFLVSDDVLLPGDESALVPGPYTVVGRAGPRVLLRSDPDRDPRASASRSSSPPALD